MKPINGPDLQQFMSTYRDEQRAGEMEAYMRNKFVFFGIRSQRRKEIFRSYLKMHHEPMTASTVVGFAHSCWKLPERELHYCAVDLLAKHASKLQPTDLDHIESLVLIHSWWDTVDAIASNVYGPLFANYPNQIDESISRWMQSESIWLHRCCLLFQLKYKSQTDVELLKCVILALQHSPEFFIQKAIGWSLRQYAKTDPKFVLEFTQQHILSNLAKREALKHLR